MHDFAPNLLALRDRLGRDHFGRRLRAQVDRMVQFAGRGPGGVHFEQLSLFMKAMEWSLRRLGVYDWGLRNALAFEHRLQSVPLSRLPKAFDGFRILHLSDLHLDAHPGMGKALAQAISGQAFDLCVLTGDFRFHDTGRYAHIAEELESLTPALNCPHGVYGILGNHDYLEMVPLLERLGVKMLINESCEIRHQDESLWLVGLDDVHLYGMHNWHRALQKVPHQALSIVLVHSPELIDQADRHGMDLYLTGHTHGGQICLPGGIPLYVHARCSRKYAVGRWTHGNMQGYTSKGIGTSGVGVRYFCPPEIVIHRLQRAERGSWGTTSR